MPFGTRITHLPIKQRISIGCEVHPHYLDAPDIDQLINTIDHAQITFPTLIRPEALELLQARTNLILHSTLLSPLEHGPSDYQSFAPAIVRISPKLLVEHFANFGRSRRLKTPIHFSPLTKQEEQKTAERILRWQDQTKSPLALENIPITENPDIYFETFIKVAQETNCKVTCDLSHFLLSANAGKWSYEKIKGIARQLNPEQVHISGTSISNQKLIDDHNKIDETQISLAKHLFPQSKYLTLEQSAKFKLRPLISKLRSTESAPKIGKNPTFPNADTQSHQEMNIEISLSKAQEYGLKSEIAGVNNGQNESEKISGPFELFETLHTYIHPIQSLKSESPSLEVREAIKIAANFIRSSLAYSEWATGRRDSRAVIQILNPDNTPQLQAEIDSTGNVTPQSSSEILFSHGFQMVLKNSQRMKVTYSEGV
jgi:uncharacterized protein (UPF0276 family)